MRSDPLPIGTQLDHFQIDAVLGHGAMGQVYQAHDTLTGKVVALKVLLPHLCLDQQFLAGFEHEISLTAAMDHPHIALYAGHGRWQGQSYLAIEHVPGPSLLDLLNERGCLSERQSLEFVIQIAQGLSYAVERCQLIHRDIKPANLLIDLRGQPEAGSQSVVKIIDFGLAQARRRNDFEEFGVESTLVGSNRMVGGDVGLGTPYYLSPEQADGHTTLDFRSDLYAVGATLFHMLTGRVPYPAANAMMAIIAHIKEPVPDPGDIVASLQPATRNLVKRCLAKDPRQRYLSYDQFIRMAKAAVESLASTTRTVRRPLSDGIRRPVSGQTPVAAMGAAAQAEPFDVDDRLTPPQPMPTVSGAEALREATSRIIRRRAKAPDGEASH